MMKGEATRSDSGVPEPALGRQAEQLHAALRDARQREAEIAALLEGSRAVLQYREFPAAARAIFDICKKLIGAGAGYVALLDASGAENELLFLDPGGLPCTVDPSLPMPIRGLRAEAYRSGEAVYRNDFSSSEWARFLPPGHACMDNVLFAPLVVAGDAVGLLGLANKPGGFEENDARIAAAFGELAAIALQNSRMLQALEESEERYRLLLESITDGVYVLDRDWRYVVVTDAAAALVNMPREKLLGAKITTLFPGIENTPFFQAYRQVMESREPSVAAAEFVLPDGRRGWYEVRIYPAPEGILCIATDVTKRKQAEEALRLDEERYQALFELSQMVQRSEAEIIEFALEASVRLTRSPIGYLHFVRENGSEIDLELFTWSKRVRQSCAAPNICLLYTSPSPRDS